MKIRDELIKLFSQEEFYKKYINVLFDDKLKDKDITVQSLSGGAKNFFAYSTYKSLLEKGGSPVLLYIKGSKKATEEAYLDIKDISGNDPNVMYFPDWETVDYEHISPFQDIIHQRIMVLHKLVTEEPALIVAPVKALMRRLIPKDIFAKEYVKLDTDEDYELQKLIKLLVELGYEPADKVVEAGTFTLKGGILDIFPSAFENPARIEFWGDTIDSIRIFDPVTQKSIKKNIKSVEILPQRELILTDDYVLNCLGVIEERFDRNYRDYNNIIESLNDKYHFQGIERFQPFFYNDALLTDYLNENSRILFDEKETIDKFSAKILFEAEKHYSQSHRVNDIKPEPEEIYASIEEIRGKLQSCINITDLIRYNENINEDFDPSDIERYIINATVHSTDNFGGDFDLFREFIEGNPEKAVVIFSTYEAQANRLYNALWEIGNVHIINENENSETDSNKKKISLKKQSKNASIKGSHIYIVIGNYSDGFDSTKFVLLPDREIRGKRKSYSKKLRKVNSAPIETFLDLKNGDFVVHVNYGIGKFIGIERMNVMDKERDFIKIMYDGEETLYVPIEQLNLVQKYIGAEIKKVKLDKIGSKSWERTKKRVEKSVKEMAEELIKIYSAREKLTGYSFNKDTQYQMQFESEFEFEETPDQMTAIEEVKKDMENNKPMDRLICGDVGYGKTEVAIRSAFKCTMDGKQTAVLVPTTILCEQHYLTFKERFKNYPIVVEMLSRFRSRKEQKKVMEGLKNGYVDIVVGTHRVLSKDITFKNLGLIVIDEEQRFGVKHKERLKKIRTLVDVISMSATPIPRTLHMSLTNIRDMSVINTPPENRLPIQTYTMEFSEQIIRDAIIKELNRGGQVFFLYNRVKTIKSFAQFVMRIVPEAKVCVGHGQMDEKELEKILMDFINKKYDVLVCTTIIENGIDIPNVNTILIDRADTFGLSQLYQIRGRVGRGQEQAYCYLFYPSELALTEVAQKRLSIINEFTDLGSGFKVAMRDMEMRGAGNILGAEQSGDIIAVGYEMYCKLLDDAIAQISNKEEIIAYEVYIDLNYDGYIPDEYIPDEKQKMEVYKRIAGCMSEDDVGMLHEELIDRFGDPPHIVNELIKISELKALCNKLRIPRVQEKTSVDGKTKDEWVEVEFMKFSLIDPLKILPLMKSSKGKIYINPNTPNRLYMKICGYGLEAKINYIKKTLEHLKINKKS